MLRGWTGYYRYGNCTKDMTKLKRYVEMRVRTHLMRKRGQPGRGYKRYPDEYLYKRLGLYKIPLSAPWTDRAKAYGRR